MNTEKRHTNASDSRELYRRILGQSLHSQAFYRYIAVILDTDPYFMPGYLEMLWNAEKRRDEYLYGEIEKRAFAALKSIIASREIRRMLSTSWTEFETEAMHELAETLSRRRQRKVRNSILLCMLRFSRDLVTPHEKISAAPRKHLVLKKRIDISALKREAASVDPYWWQVDTGRRENVIYHQDTWSITLRRKANSEGVFEKADGNHESVPTIEVKRFPLIHDEALLLSEELRIGLGRVVIVMMKPWSQAYRHWDPEPHLIGRDRYHLVLSCGGGNVLSSGPETVVAQEGDLWFFDNKVMHRAHNKSDIPRIHVIFDGYPLSQLNA